MTIVKLTTLKGVSINFTELEDHMKATENIKIIWGKVWYTEEDKRQCIYAFLEDVIELFSEIPDKKCRKDMVIEVLTSVINNMRIFIEHESFEAEKKYRATLIVPEEVINNNELPDDYTQGFKQENIKKPYIDVPFDLKSITNIIVNPDGDFDFTNADLEDWLKEQNLNDIEIWTIGRAHV